MLYNLQHDVLQHEHLAFLDVELFVASLQADATEGLRYMHSIGEN